MFDVFLKKQSAGEHDGSALRDSVVRGPQEGPWWGLGRPSKRDYPDPPCEDPVPPPPICAESCPHAGGFQILVENEAMTMR